MRLYRTTAIVLKNKDLGEADKVVTLYSPTYGKIRAVAKGARRTQSKFGSSMEILTYLDLLLYSKEDKELNIVTQCAIRESFREVREDLKKIAYGSYLLELIDSLVGERAGDPPLFALLLKTLRLLKGDGDLELVVRSFELKFLEILGLKPHLEGCSMCGKNIVGFKMKFSPLNGGVICLKCGLEDKEALEVYKGTIDLMRWIFGVDLAKVKELPPPLKIRGQLGEILNFYLACQLGRELNSLKLLRYLA